MEGASTTLQGGIKIDPRDVAENWLTESRYNKLGRSYPCCEISSIHPSRSYSKVLFQIVQGEKNEYGVEILKQQHEGAKNRRLLLGV